MSFASNSSFQPHLKWFWFDVVSLVVAGGVIGWISFKNKAMSGDETTFSLWTLIGFSLVYLIAYFVIGLTYDGEKYLGLPFLLRVATFGSLLYLCGSMALIYVHHGGDSLATLGVSIALFLFISLTLLVFFSMLLARLIGFLVGKIRGSSRRVVDMD